MTTQIVQGRHLDQKTRLKYQNSEPSSTKKKASHRGNVLNVGAASSEKNYLVPYSSHLSPAHRTWALNFIAIDNLTPTPFSKARLSHRTSPPERAWHKQPGYKRGGNRHMNAVVVSWANVEMVHPYLARGRHSFLGWCPTDFFDIFGNNAGAKNSYYFGHVSTWGLVNRKNPHLGSWDYPFWNPRGNLQQSWNGNDLSSN